MYRYIYSTTSWYLEHSKNVQTFIIKYVQSACKPTIMMIVLMISVHDSGHDTGHDLGHNSVHDTGHDLGHDAGYQLGYGSGGMCTKCIIKTIPISRLDPQYTRNNVTSTSMFPGQSPSESCTAVA